MSFLRTFVDYLCSRTDAPPDYHLLAGLVTESAAMGSNVWMDGRGRFIYPNLWGVIIGPSGSGKSVPLDMSKRILEKAGLGERIASDSFSIEAMLDEFKLEPSRILYSQEFSATMGMLNRDYNQGATQFLTEIYDVPDVYRRRLRRSKDQDGMIELQKPCLSILAATAPDWFAEQFKLSALRSGFLVRFLYCPREKRGKYVEDPGPFDEAIDAQLADHLRQIGELRGRADFSQCASALNQWERRNREALSDCPSDFAGMRSRAGVLVKKLAVLFHVSQNPTNLRVNEQDVGHAIKYVERIHGEAEAYLSERVAHDKDDGERLRILEIAERAGGRVSWSKALKDSHLDAARFKRAVDTLLQSERVMVGSVDGQAGRFIVVRHAVLRAVS